MAIDFIEDGLAPIVLKANQCIDKDLLFIVKEDDQQDIWKTIFLVAIVLLLVLRSISYCHQRKMLKDEDTILLNY